MTEIAQRESDLTRAFVDAVGDRHFTRAWEAASEVVPWTDRAGSTYCWLLLPSRNTWPSRHADRPAPTPGCMCASCSRPRCCGTWAEPVDLVITGETVAWICATCLEPVGFDRRP